jgi:hypothetical protein
MAKIVDFSWVPSSGALSYTISGNTYPYSTQADSISRVSDSRYATALTPLDTTLTFTAAVTDIVAIEYRWDFGNGKIGYGATVTQKFLTASAQRRIKLTVTDDKGKKYSRSKLLNLSYAVEAPLMTTTTLQTSLLLKTRG